MRASSRSLCRRPRFSRARPCRCRDAAEGPSLEAPEVFSDGREIAVAEIVRRHLVSRLELMRVADPTLEIVCRVGQNAGRYRRARSHVRELGAVCASRQRPANGVALRAGGAKKDFTPTKLCVGRGFDRRLALHGQPRLKIVLRNRTHEYGHVRVLQTTKFGALAAIGAFAVGLKPQ